jgi:hypothetical protein
MKKPATKPVAAKAARPKDWRKVFAEKKAPKTVVLKTDFAGTKAGNTLYIATPGIIANYVAKIARGQTRSIERMRNELARKNGAVATCPVTTAIFLRIVCEAAWDELQDGAAPETVVPFWRVVEAGTPIAKRLRCDGNWLTTMRELEQT